MGAVLISQNFQEEKFLTTLLQDSHTLLVLDKDGETVLTSVTMVTKKDSDAPEENQ